MIVDVYLSDIVVDADAGGSIIDIGVALDGPPGPPGTGGGVADFIFTQAFPATPWVVNHNLGRKPLVAVLDVGGNEVEAAVQHISVNQLRVSFAAPQAGSARCI
ncbi:MAG: hypothetical protein WDM92_06330 [Caulobacteraceae bacterium]